METTRARVLERLEVRRPAILNASVAVGAGLGLVLALLWSMGLSRSPMRWLTVLDAGAALVALTGAALLRPAAMLGVVLWVFVSVELVAIWLLGMAMGAPAGLAWIHFGLAFAFLALALTASAAHR